LQPSFSSTRAAYIGGTGTVGNNHDQPSMQVSSWQAACEFRGFPGKVGVRKRASDCSCSFSKCSLGEGSPSSPTYLCLFEVFLDCSGRNLRELRRKDGGPFFRVVRPSHGLSKSHPSVSDSLPAQAKARPASSSPEKLVSANSRIPHTPIGVKCASLPRSKVDDVNQSLSMTPAPIPSSSVVIGVESMKAFR
jgi:hypothetical protein